MIRLFAVLFLLFPNLALAQVTAPDYQDPAKWVYRGGDSEALFPVDENYAVWHEHYASVIIPNQELMVIYKPLKIEVYKKYGEAKFADISREQPWLLLNFITNDLYDVSFQLFEYVNGSWKHIKTLSQEKELSQFLYKEYGLR